MKPLLLDLVAGARPNFIKLAPVARALATRDRIALRLVHTGQHYDADMSRVFFSGLRIPEPDVHLEVGSGTQGQQTARILERYEALLLDSKPAATIVFGDVNSTVACALAAVKLGVPIVHVEAGLRSFDRTMPEEINRILTDAISDLLLVTEESGLRNLENEGIPSERIHLVGNVMIDTLLAELPAGRALDVPGRLGLAAQDYGLVTIHRPANVDDQRTLESLLRLLRHLSADLPLVFPVHPRTRAAARQFELEDLLAPSDRFVVTTPLPYHDTIGLMSTARVVITDSGGVQEETSALGVPCLTLRPSTERPVTTERGTSVLVGNDPARIREAFQRALSGGWTRGQPIPHWDGSASERVAERVEAWAAGLGGR